MIKITSYWVVFTLCVLVITGCKIEPEPLSYGKDVCQFCSMTIIDKQHGSELVTQKGKVYKFDAVECLLNYNQKPENPKGALFLCNHYTNPGELISVEEATFLISEGIPSPMGAYLTAFDSEQKAEELKKEFGGDLYSWSELKEYWREEYVYYE